MYIYIFISSNYKLVDLRQFNTILEIPISSKNETFRELLNLDEKTDPKINISDNGIFIDTLSKSLKDNKQENIKNFIKPYMELILDKTNKFYTSEPSFTNDNDEPINGYYEIQSKKLSGLHLINTEFYKSIMEYDILKNEKEQGQNSNKQDIERIVTKLYNNISALETQEAIKSKRLELRQYRSYRYSNLSSEEFENEVKTEVALGFKQDILKQIKETTRTIQTRRNQIKNQLNLKGSTNSNTYVFLVNYDIRINTDDVDIDKLKTNLNKSIDIKKGVDVYVENRKKCKVNKQIYNTIFDDVFGWMTGISQYKNRELTYYTPTTNLNIQNMDSKEKKNIETMAKYFKDYSIESLDDASIYKYRKTKPSKAELEYTRTSLWDYITYAYDNDKQLIIETFKPIQEKIKTTIKDVSLMKQIRQELDDDDINRIETEARNNIVKEEEQKVAERNKKEQEQYDKRMKKEQDRKEKEEEKQKKKEKQKENERKTKEDKNKKDQIRKEQLKPKVISRMIKERQKELRKKKKNSDNDDDSDSVSESDSGSEN